MNHTLSTCIPDCDVCHRSGSLGFCCSGMCIQMQGDEFGYCQSTQASGCDITEHPTCIPDCEECQWSGSLGFCCSGMCAQTEDIGHCRPKNTTLNCEGIDFPEENSGKLILQLLPYLLSGLVIVVLSGVSLWLWHYWRNRKDKVLSKDEVIRFSRGSNATDYTMILQDAGEMYSKICQHIDSIPYDEKFEVSKSDFSIDADHILGKGQFGTVFKATVHGQFVAAKTVKENVDKIYLMALLTELKVLIYLKHHDHIVSLIGANTCQLRKGLVYIFLEYCPLGSLDSFLKLKQKSIKQNISTGQNGYSQLTMPGYIQQQPTHPNSSCSSPCSTQTMLNWSLQIAKSLSYLESKSVIHADIAARNVLLYSENHLKLTDFGLSRRLYEHNVYSKTREEPLPWRWMAPESLKSLTFSIRSDIWSFGVFMWEVFTLGNVPFPEMSWSESYVLALQAGMRLTQPDLSSDAIYNIMSGCWEFDANERPSANDIITQLSVILEKSE